MMGLYDFALELNRRLSGGARVSLMPNIEDGGGLILRVHHDRFTKFYECGSRFSLEFADHVVNDMLGMATKYKDKEPSISEAELDAAIAIARKAWSGDGAPRGAETGRTQIMTRKALGPGEISIGLRVRIFLRDNPGTYTAGELARQFGLTRTSILLILQDMQGYGWPIEKIGASRNIRWRVAR